MRSGSTAAGSRLRTCVALGNSGSPCSPPFGLVDGLGCACLVAPDIARWVGIKKPALVGFWNLQEPCQHAGAGNMIVGPDAINRGDGLVCRAGNLYRQPPCPFRWTRQTATGEMHFGAGWRTVGLSCGRLCPRLVFGGRRCGRDRGGAPLLVAPSLGQGVG